MKVDITVTNNNKFHIAGQEFLPADYTLTIRLPADKNLTTFILQTLQNILLSNNIPFAIGGDQIE